MVSHQQELMDQLLCPSDDRYQSAGPRVLLFPNTRQEVPGVDIPLSGAGSERSRGFHRVGTAGASHGGRPMVDHASSRCKPGRGPARVAAIIEAIATELIALGVGE